MARHEAVNLRAIPSLASGPRIPILIDALSGVSMAVRFAVNGGDGMEVRVLSFKNKRFLRQYPNTGAIKEIHMMSVLV